MAAVLMYTCMHAHYAYNCFNQFAVVQKVSMKILGDRRLEVSMHCRQLLIIRYHHLYLTQSFLKC